MKELFGFDILPNKFKIFSYGHDEGLHCHGSVDELPPQTCFVFLINAAPNFLIENAPFSAKIFYLDFEYFKRLFLPQSYHLIYLDDPCGLSFDGWAENVIRYLSACLKAPAIPAFDFADISSVLLEVKRTRLHFKIMPFENALVLPFGIAEYNRLLLVIFSSPEKLMPMHVDRELAQCEAIADWVAGGAAFHPHESSIALFLGDEKRPNEPEISTKDPRTPHHLRAIY